MKTAVRCLKGDKRPFNVCAMMLLLLARRDTGEIMGYV